MSTHVNGEPVDPIEPLQTDPPIASGENAAEEEIDPVIIGPPIKINPIAIDDARILLRNYQASAATPAVPVKGVFLDRSQFEAMKQLVEANPKLPGFRVLFGRETAGSNVSIVLGVDGNNRDLVNNQIYVTQSPKTGPCPPICDATSPINQGDMG